MLDLKKYFTDGLIQVAILLSLAGMRVDVDPYLPPLGRALVGPSSAITQTQFRNLQNTLDGYHLHPKSVDLDGFFTARRLLRWVRSLDHLQVPAVELEAWLVHREPENGVSIPSQMGFLEDGGLEDVEDPSELSMRLGGGDLGYDIGEDDTFGAVEHTSRSLTHPDQNEVIKEEEDDMSVLWEQEHYQDQLENAGTQPLQLFNEEEDFMMDGWRNTNVFHNQMFEENVQLSGVRGDNSLSIEECLHLIEADFLSGEDSELTGPDAQNVEEHELQFQGPFISSLLSEQNSTFSLEQQWQDVLAIMESQDMDTAETIDNSHHNISQSNRNTGSMENFIHQDVNLHQATEVPGFSEGLNNNSITMEETLCINNSCVENTGFERSSNENRLFEDSEIIDLLLSPGINSSVSPCPLFDQQNLLSHLDPLLEEAMHDETGLMDLALDEFNQAQLPQFEEHKQADSDSGLSLDCSQSPSSPTGSESSSSSSSSYSASSPLTTLIPEEGAVGFTHIKEEEEEGAIGGFMPEETKMCRTSFLEAKQFHSLPWLEQIGHDHTYNQPQTSIQKKSPKHCFDEPAKEKMLEQLSSRDEKRARALNIPFPNEFIINLPVEDFNQLLLKYHLTDAQLTLIRDIRRRGKNKMAAQICRRRKMDVLVGLERSMDGLRRHRSRLLRENAEISRSVREMKQRLNSLYQEVCERLREEQGSLCSDYGFGLEENGNSSVGLVSRRSDSHSRRKLSKRRKDKK